MTMSCPRCGLLHPSGSPCFSLGLSVLRGKDELPAGTILAGRYRVERMLHHGGMSVIYLATDLRRGCPVALKELRLPEGAGQEEQHEAEKWFARESFLLSSLAHPAIPAFRGSFGEGGRSYL